MVPTVPNPDLERLVAGWGVQQVQSKDEREKKCDCKAKKPAQDDERKVLVKAT